MALQAIRTIRATGNAGASAGCCAVVAQHLADVAGALLVSRCAHLEQTGLADGSTESSSS